MSLPERARVLFDAWFGPFGDPDRERRRKIWFRSTGEFDALLRDAFRGDHEMAVAGGLAAWEGKALGALALVLLLDQIPRNIFRGTPRAWASDAVARAAADRALERGFDGALPPVWRKFFYLPFEHSEILADQHRAVALFERLPEDPDWPDTLHIARRHREIIERFGRFPHRNAVLGRAPSAAEIAFLDEPDSSF